ncbi:hypothetical protein HNY73_009978 [Argiope bruennichi]|uniref:Uncharacterized protein n=1 Tax=Argiope bruennichi TaxID=94029 RepID=A0A8T0F1Q9_ARGBR|nr:hypothetical protein HNY73_009978 [Argiope bruennichi]
MSILWNSNELQHEKPIRCRPYRLSEPDRQFLKTQIEKWLKQGICRHSNSPYVAPAFIVEQPFHESTPRRIVPRLPRELHIGSFIDDTPREDQLDLLTLARAEAANNVYETHLENKKRFDLHRRSHSFKAGDLVLYDWPKKGDHKLSPIFKGPFVIIRPVGTVCYEIKSTTQQNKFIKVVLVQHLRSYFKRNSSTIEENSTDEENERH